MPLPKPPAKKAALLAPADYDLKPVASAPAAKSPATAAAPAAVQRSATAVVSAPMTADAAATSPAAFSATKADQPAGSSRKSGGKRAANTSETTPKSLQSPSVVSPGLSPLSTLAQATRPKSDRTSRKSRKHAHDGPPRLFVLDTNVLMHDP